MKYVANKNLTLMDTNAHSFFSSNRSDTKNSASIRTIQIRGDQGKVEWEGQYTYLAQSKVKSGFGRYDQSGSLHEGQDNFQRIIFPANSTKEVYVGVQGPEPGYGILRYRNGDIEEGKWAKSKL